MAVCPKKWEDRRHVDVAARHRKVELPIEPRKAVDVLLVPALLEAVRPRRRPGRDVEEDVNVARRGAADALEPRELAVRIVLVRLPPKSLE
jgi:hypothetical protein